MRSPLHAPTVLVAAIALATALAGCSLLPQPEPTPTPTPTAESVKAACKVLETELASINDDLTEGTGLLMTDPAAGAVIIEGVATTFEGAIAEVENEDVIDAVTPAAEALRHFSDLMTDFATDPLSIDTEELTTTSEELTAAMTAMSDVCG